MGGGITWGEVDLDTTVDDLIGGPTLTFTPFAYDGGNAEGTFWTGDGGTTGDDILDSIYNSHGWNGGGASITLDGLDRGRVLPSAIARGGGHARVLQHAEPGGL